MTDQGVNQAGGPDQFDLIRRAFADACQTSAVPCVEKRMVLAGRAAVVRIAGRTCAEAMLPPINHLVSGSQDASPVRPELRIDIYDSAETGIPPVAETIGREKTDLEFGWVSGHDGDRFVACHRPAMVTWFDRLERHVIGCVVDGRGLDLYEWTKPLLYPLLLWHCDRGVPVIHAGLVARAESGILLAGGSGSGKSTAAMACLNSDAGFTYLGDDYIGLEMIEGRADGDREDGELDVFIGHSIYNTVWLDPEDAGRFAWLMPFIPRGSAPRVPVVLNRVEPGLLARQAEIRAVVIPQIVPGPESSIRATTAASAILALAPTSTLKRPCPGTVTFNAIARLTDRVPSYVLEMGSDITRIPRLVSQILDSTGNGNDG